MGIEKQEQQPARQEGALKLSSLIINIETAEKAEKRFLDASTLRHAIESGSISDAELIHQIGFHGGKTVVELQTEQEAYLAAHPEDAQKEGAERDFICEGVRRTVRTCEAMRQARTGYIPLDDNTRLRIISNRTSDANDAEMAALAWVREHQVPNLDEEYNDPHSATLIQLEHPNLIHHVRIRESNQEMGGPLFVPIVFFDREGQRDGCVEGQADLLSVLRQMEYFKSQGHASQLGLNQQGNTVEGDKEVRYFVRS